MVGRRDKKTAIVDDDQPITADRLRSQFRELTGDADELATEFRDKAIAAGVVAGVVLMLLIFLIGRSRGKKATTVVEIVRV